MKYIGKLQLWLIITLFACLSSCTDDLGVKGGKKTIREGVPVTLSMGVEVGRSSVVTREASNSEDIVNAIYVFVFNRDGSLDTKSRFEGDQLKSIQMSNVHSGTGKRIYAVGNPQSGSGTLTNEQLGEVDTEEQLLALTSSLNMSINVGRSFFLMSAKLAPTDPAQTIDIDENGTIINADPTFHLERVDARITFRVKGESANPNFKDFTFTADRYWVEQIPQTTYVFPKEEDYPNCGYASMSDEGMTVPFEGVSTEGDNAGYNIFEFYIVENRLAPSRPIAAGDAGSENAENLYALREKREKTPIDEGEADPNRPGQSEKNGPFKYANPHSTYVVFRGVLSYRDETNPSSPEFVHADVTYTVHLGNTGGADDANNPEKVNNYNTERNTHYIYTVTVTGIESMKVEVEEKTEQRPGMEGDVIIAGERVESVDSHYGRTHITLRRGDIKSGLSWAINTPFQRGMKVFLEEDHKDESGNVTENLPAEKLKKLQTGLELNDYKWVHFVVNKEAMKAYNTPVPSSEFAKYPGYAAYSGGESNTVAAPAFGGEGYHAPGAYYASNVVLYDVNQLLNHLYVEAQKADSEVFDKAPSGDPDDDTVAITAFIDEYVYIYDPTRYYYKPPVAVSDGDPEFDLTLWKKVVNGEERMLHFCIGKDIYSPDGESSLARSVLTISQKPIYTFYNKEEASIQTAWGTEAVMEARWLNTTNARVQLADTYPNTESNGRMNTLNIIPKNRVLRWTDVLSLSTDQWGTLNDPYNTIWFACLGRNRDLDGDNIVDPEEIRWYLASIDQLTDLWIGQNSLNSEAWLYQGEGADGTTRLHVASSSYCNNRADDVWVIWAEEGASRGSYTDSKGSNAHGEQYEYRCVRNLGLSLSTPDADPADYVALSKGTYNNGSQTYDEYIIDVERLEINSRRTYDDNGRSLPHHNEREGHNRPYQKLAVLRGVAGDKDEMLYPEKELSWENFQNYNPCPSGYRVPNQRELMLMYTSLNDEHEGYAMNWTGNYVTYTAFGYNGKEPLYGERNRPGFLFKGNNLILETTGFHSVRARCVRDVTE